MAQHDPDPPPAPTLQVFHREARPNLPNRSVSGINESAELRPKGKLGKSQVQRASSFRASTIRDVRAIASGACLWTDRELPDAPAVTTVAKHSSSVSVPAGSVSASEVGRSCAVDRLLQVLQRVLCLVDC